MTQWLKQLTAGTIMIGPFLDDTDGKTAETALTISQGDILLSKNGGAFAQISGTANATHGTLGYYAVVYGTADTNALGPLKIVVHESGALPVWQDFMVVSGNMEQSMLAMVGGTAVTGTLTNSRMSTNLTEATDNHYNGRVIIWTSGALAGQASAITAYDGVNKILTYQTVTDAPSNGDTFILV